MFKRIGAFLFGRKSSSDAEEVSEAPEALNESHLAEMFPEATPDVDAGSDEASPIAANETRPVEISPEAAPDAVATSDETPSIKDDKAEWKRRALSDFGEWLDDLADEHPVAEYPPEKTCDLFSLFSELSALRQEVRMQNREQHKTLQHLDAFSAVAQKNADALSGLDIDYRGAMETVEKISREMTAASRQVQRKLEEELHREIEKRTLMPFLDIRDALVRGLEAARTADVPEQSLWVSIKKFSRKSVKGLSWASMKDISWEFIKGNLKEAVKELYWRRIKGIEGIIEGYEMAIRRFDRAIAAVGVKPVRAEGKAFDPAVMRAVQTDNRPDLDRGIVLKEELSGFVRGDEVIRTAEVVVND